VATAAAKGKAAYREVKIKGRCVAVGKIRKDPIQTDCRKARTERRILRASRETVTAENQLKTNLRGWGNKTTDDRLQTCLNRGGNPTKGRSSHLRKNAARHNRPWVVEGAIKIRLMGGQYLSRFFVSVRRYLPTYRKQ